ncbi:hypothetical protein [Arthrobacter sp. 2MCAF14]|uniref:hypothetical protein n=1 Tax=Arthrobacter sp. 2MCAF14 TaxID=3232982 RepID=UPI003F9051A6
MKLKSTVIAAAVTLALALVGSEAQAAPPQSVEASRNAQVAASIYGPSGAIGDYWNTNSGWYWYGQPTNSEYGAWDGSGWSAQDFEQGTIVWSPRFGTYGVRGAIYQDWSGDGGAYFAHAGLPKTEEHDVPGGRVQDFTSGWILWSPWSGAHPVRGGIAGSWWNAGGPSSALGYPLEAEGYAYRNGASQKFQRGYYYWSAGTGTHSVRGGILGRWDAMGGLYQYGYPRTEEIWTPGGTYQLFEAGTVVWNGAVGNAFGVDGGIGSAWWNNGGPNGRLGLPRTGEYYSGFGVWAQSFDHGTVYWSSTRGTWIG